MPTFTIRDDEVLLDRVLHARSEAARQDAWRELVQRFSRLIASCVRRTFERWRLRPSEEDVDDLAGDVWIALLHDDLRRLRAFDPSRGARLSTFIGLIATNLTIDRLRVYLDGLGQLPEVFQAELADEADALGERLRTEVRAMGRPASSAMFEHVYATPHAVVAAEREWFEGYESSFEGSAR